MTSTLSLAVMFVLDLNAFALAVAAEQRRNTAKIANDGQDQYCLYDSDIATGLGVGSFFFLVVSQIIIMVATRCLCCGRAMRPGGSRSFAIFLFFISW